MLIVWVTMFGLPDNQFFLKELLTMCSAILLIFVGTKTLRRDRRIRAKEIREKEEHRKD